MGPIAARKLLRAVDALEHVLSIEARMALEGVRIIGLKPAKGVQPLFERLAAACAPWNDRPMYEELSKTVEALRAHSAAH